MIPSDTISSWSVQNGEEDYKLQDGRMGGLCRGLDAVIGWMTVALTTERGGYPIFSKEFGVSMTASDDDALIRTLTAALMRDDRIRGVEDVKITRERGEVSARLTVKTIYGTAEAEAKLNV